jgi:hypothetical protein
MNSPGTEAPTCRSCKKEGVKFFLCDLCLKYRLCIPCDNIGTNLQWLEIDEKEMYVCSKCIKKKGLKDGES